MIQNKTRRDAIKNWFINSKTQRSRNNKIQPLFLIFFFWYWRFVVRKKWINWIISRNFTSAFLWILVFSAFCLIHDFCVFRLCSLFSVCRFLVFLRFAFPIQLEFHRWSFRARCFPCYLRGRVEKRNAAKNRVNFGFAFAAREREREIRL